MLASDTVIERGPERAVQGESGACYRLGPELGRGGQGRVHRARGGRFAVKLLPLRGDTSAEVLRRRLQAVRRLPLDDVSVSLPQEFLRPPDVGYVMELLTELRPLTWLLVGPRGVNLADWYYQTGGLRHRLTVLAGVASVFARLHGRGVVYGDASPNNTFVPGPGHHGIPWLIDPDNMHYAGQAHSRPLCTPRYGAPELERAEAPTSVQTDLHSLAVMIFQVLTLVHPLLGDAVIDAAYSEELLALKGGLPWVDDANEPSNRSSHGVQRACVLTQRLQSLARQAFGLGRRDPDARPTASAWAEALHAAAHWTVDCTSCRASFLADQPTCAWCGLARPTHVRVYRQLGVAGSEAHPQAWSPVAVLQDGHEIVLTDRAEVIMPLQSLAGGEVRLRLGPDTIRIAATACGSVLVRSPGGERRVERSTPLALSLDAGRLTQEWVILGAHPHDRTLLRWERIVS